MKQITVVRCLVCQNFMNVEHAIPIFLRGFYINQLGARKGIEDQFLCIRDYARIENPEGVLNG